MIFQQVDCEIPAVWSQLATNVVVSKYFYGDVPAATAARRTGSASIGPPVGRPRHPDHRRLGQGRRLFRHRRRRRAVLRRADLALPEPVRLVQLAGLVQRRAVPPLRDLRARPTTGDGTRRPAAVVEGHQRLRVPAGVGLLHPERRRRHGRDHAAGDQRGHAVQVRLGDRHRPLDPPLQPARSSPAAASRRGRSASCGSTTPSPASSSRAARPAAPPRCRPSSAGTPTSSSSSSARPRRRRRPRP